MTRPFARSRRGRPKSPELLARGLANNQVATALGMSLKTVQNHVSAICLKLNVPDRATLL